MKNYLLLLAAIAYLTGCTKNSDLPANPAPDFIKYTIAKGSHYADRNSYQPIEQKQVDFIVKFDQSAAYTSLDPVNQYDINKLYGFSDNAGHHHQYSARIGWRWSDQKLRLFAYVYNQGVLTSKELSSVLPGEEIRCSIAVDGAQYIFKVNDHIDYLPRVATTAVASGYRLYPYFGGDEVAPHDIAVWIKDLP